MTVALITGQHEGIIPQLERIYDKDKILGGSELRQFLNLNLEKNIFFKRIVIAYGSIKEEEVEQVFSYLRSYIENYSPNLEVVFIYNHESKSMAEEFEKEFKAPTYTPILMKATTTINDLESYFSLSILDLKAQRINDEQESRMRPRDGRLSPSELEQHSHAKKTKKKGFFSGLMDGFKKPKPAQIEESEESMGESVRDSDLQLKNESIENISVQEISPEIEAQPIIIETDENNFDESSDALNFGEFGDEHFQTGYIEEEDLEEEFVDEIDSGNSNDFIGNYLDPALAVAMQAEELNSIQKPETIHLRSGFSLDLPDEENNVQSKKPRRQYSEPTSSDLSKNKVIKFRDPFIKIPPMLILIKGVSLFVGEEAPRFVAHYLSSEENCKILEVGSRDMGNLFNVTENSYKAESGNEFKFEVQLYSVSSYISDDKQKTIIVCKDIGMLEQLITELSVHRVNVYTIFSSKKGIFEEELLSYESVSIKVAKTLNKGMAIFSEGVNPTIIDTIDSATFSKIAWKRLVS